MWQCQPHISAVQRQELPTETNGSSFISLSRSLALSLSLSRSLSLSLSKNMWTHQSGETKFRRDPRALQKTPRGCTDGMAGF